jgi:hypothetical protein
MLRTIPIEEFLLCCHGEPLPSARRSDHTASPVGGCISGRETTRLCCFHGCLFACCLKPRFAERRATRYEKEREEAEELKSHHTGQGICKLYTTNLLV